MVAIRFKSASHYGHASPWRLPQLTPSYDLNLRLSQEQSCSVVGVDFGGTAVLGMHLSLGESRVVGHDDLSDSFSLVFIVDGAMALVDGSAEQPVRAERGDIWTFSRSTSIDIAVLADAQMVAVTLPAQVLQEFGLDESHALRALDPNSSLLSPALGFLREIALQDAEVSSVAAYFMEKLVHEMVGGIMLENRGIRFTATPRKGFFEQAMDFIAATAGDIALTPASLAEELSLSLRQLQREFKRNNTTIAVAILQRRIDLAVRLLKDSKMDVLSLAEIAEHSGFSSTVQLRRTLREARVGNPSEIRALAVEQGNDSRRGSVVRILQTTH